MGKFIAGDVVVVPFPFSNLSKAKKRPALVLADLEGEDLVLCQITSQHIYDRYGIKLCEKDFAKGSLNKKSNIRPNRLFTADTGIVLYKAGKLKTEKIQQSIRKVIQILQ